MYFIFERRANIEYPVAQIANLFVMVSLFL